MARGRDVSLRIRGGYSPENHTVVSEWCWKPPTDRSGNDVSDQSSQSAEHVVVNYTGARAPTASQRSRRAQCRRGIQEDVTYHKVSLGRIRDRGTAKKPVVREKNRRNHSQGASGENPRQNHCQRACGEKEDKRATRV